MSGARRAPAGSPAGSRGPHRAALGLVLLLLLALLATAGASAGTLPAHPASILPTGELRVVVDDVAPAVVGPQDDVRVSGTVTNTSEQEFEDPVVLVRSASRGLDTRDALEAWSNGSDESDRGPVRGTAFLTGTLAPGDSAPFSATVPAEALAPDLTLATLPLAVQALPSSDFDGPTGEFSAENQPPPPWTPGLILPRGEARSYLPWVSDLADLEPLRTAWLVPLTLPADADLFDSDDATREAAWARALGPDSVAGDWLGGEGSLPLTYAVEPGLLTPPPDLVPLTEPAPDTEPEPTDPAEPEDGTPQTQVPDDDTTTDPGSGTPGDDDSALPAAAQDAAALRGRLQERAAQGAQVWSLPVTDLDVAALLDAGASAQQIGGRLAADPELDARTDVAWPLTSSYGDSLVADTAAAWEQSDLGALEAVVLPASAVASDGLRTVGGVLRHTSGPLVLAYDDGMSALLSGAVRADTHSAARQRLLAESLATYQEQPSLARSLVLASPRGLDPDPDSLAALEAALTAAPWLEVVDGTTLLSDARDDVPQASITGPGPTTAPGGVDIAPVPDVPAPAIDAATLEDAADTSTDLRTAAAVLPDTGHRAPGWERLLLEASSARWRQSPDAPGRLITRVQQVADAVGAGLHIVPADVNFIADQGVIQVTVVNDLELTVEDIGIDAVPSNGRLLVRDEELDRVSIGPSSRTSVQLTAQARGAGDVVLESRITAVDGRTLGEPAQITVRVQPLSAWWWWALGLVAGAILVAGVVRAARGRPRMAYEQETDVGSGTGPAEDPTDAPAGRA